MKNRNDPIILLSMMTAHEAFLSDVEAFLASSGMPPARFGKDAIGDPNFVRNLRNGRSPSLMTADRVRAFMEGRNNPAPMEAAQ